MKTLMVAVLLMSVLTGCASGPTQKQLANADYGRGMFPEECVSIAEKVIADSLKDPSSAQFKHSGLYL